MWEAGIHEFGRKAFGGAGSLCHGFATSPIDFMQTVILGICPVKPGFREFLFKPETFDLEFAEGQVPAPSGNIEIKWRKKGTKLAVILKVPENCEAITERNGRFGPGYHEFEIGQLAGKE